MNHDKLYEIMSRCVCTFRKGDPAIRFDENGRALVGAGESPITDDGRLFHANKLVDLYFLWVAIDEGRAEPHRAAFRDALGPDYGQYERGPSYIHIGAEIGDQTAALCLMGLGAHYGFWRVVTPDKLGLEGDRALKAAGMGYVMISGFKMEGEEHGNERREDERA